MAAVQALVRGRRRVLLTVLNLRGVKESVLPLVPIFLIFVVTHVFAIVYAFITHLGTSPRSCQLPRHDVRAAQSELGLLGMILLVLRAYSMGAGTYTGIEAVEQRPAHPARTAGGDRASAP